MTGANRPDEHLRGVVPGRDFDFTRGRRARRSAPGDTIAGEPVTIEPAIEVGNIFKLGTRYSEPARRELPRRERRRAADLDGLLRDRARRGSSRRPSSSSPTSTASPGRARWRPFDVHLVTLGKPGSAEREAADRLYETLLGGELSR